MEIDGGVAQRHRVHPYLRRSKNGSKSETNQEDSHGPKKVKDSVVTPDRLFDALHQIFNFTYDPCPLGGEAKDTAPNGLQEAWGPSSYVNCPYSDPAPWLAHGAEQSVRDGSRSVFLVPSNVETHYWRDYVWPYASQVWFCSTGVKFQGFDIKFPNGLCVIIYGHYSGVPQVDTNSEILIGLYRFRVLRLWETPRQSTFFTAQALDVMRKSCAY